MGKLQILQVAHSLRQAAEEILAAAGIALEGLNAETPSDAVHDYRVAFKRWRALLRLLQGQIGDEIVALRREARLFSRTFDRSRDALAALDALTDIAGPKTISAPSISERTQQPSPIGWKGFGRRRKLSRSMQRPSSACTSALRGLQPAHQPGRLNE